MRLLYSTLSTAETLDPRDPTTAVFKSPPHAHETLRLLAKAGCWNMGCFLGELACLSRARSLKSIGTVLMKVLVHHQVNRCTYLPAILKVYVTVSTSVFDGESQGGDGVAVGNHVLFSSIIFFWFLTETSSRGPSE